MVAQAAVMRDGEQDEIVAFLGSGAAFEGMPVNRIDTHMSHVFVVGDRAFKLKRAVKFNFVDFSTQALRTAACRRELEINRRWAPDLYIGLVPVVETQDGRLHLGGTGKVLEWLVEMNRFDQDDLFDVLAKKDHLTPSHIDDLGDAIAKSHGLLPRVSEVGGMDDVRHTAAEILITLREMLELPTDHDRLEAYARSLDEIIQSNERLIEVRRRVGYVRRCHGDLHLRNICLHNGRATPFDAIEFSDDIATTDVLYDIAFPVMDLVAHGLPDLANRLLNRYLHTTRDYRGLALLPAFLSMRAAVRSKIDALAAAGDRAELEAAARYLDAAESYVETRPAQLIAIGGLSGTGKSTLARRLAVDLVPPPGAIILHSDMLRKRLAGVSPEQDLGNEFYSEDFNRKVYRRMMACTWRALRSGQTVILDATFMNPDVRASAMTLVDKTGYPFQGIWLDAPDDVLRERVSQRSGDMSDADMGVLERQLAAGHGNIQWTRIDCSGPVDDTYRRILDQVAPRE